MFIHFILVYGATFFVAVYPLEGSKIGAGTEKIKIFEFFCQNIWRIQK